MGLIDCTDSSRVVLVDALPRLEQLPVLVMNFDSLSALSSELGSLNQEFQVSRTY